MSAYAELVERLLGIWAGELNEGSSPDAQIKWPDDWTVSEQSKMLGIMAAMIAEVLRTLETVTPEMVAAWVDERITEEIAFPTSEEYASASWLAMLRASPLSPP